MRGTEGDNRWSGRGKARVGEKRRKRVKEDKNSAIKKSGSNGTAWLHKITFTFSHNGPIREQRTKCFTLNIPEKR